MTSTQKVVIFCGDSSRLEECTWIPVTYYDHPMTHDMIKEFWEDLRSCKIQRNDSRLIKVIEDGMDDNIIGGLWFVSIPSNIKWNIDEGVYPERVVEICDPRSWNEYGEIITNDWYFTR